jgi:hypothetical protein
MYLDRGLLLAVAITVILFPGIERWMFADPVHWYRPFIVGAAVIAGVYWNQRRRDFDEP